MVKCPNCGMEVQPTKKNKKRYYVFFSLLYWLYVMNKDPHHCPICGAHMYKKPKAAKMVYFAQGAE